LRGPEQGIVRMVAPPHSVNKMECCCLFQFSLIWTWIQRK
jgi:hypothetical protein